MCVCVSVSAHACMYGNIGWPFVICSNRGSRLSSVIALFYSLYGKPWHSLDVIFVAIGVGAPLLFQACTHPGTRSVICVLVVMRAAVPTGWACYFRRWQPRVRRCVSLSSSWQRLMSTHAGCTTYGARSTPSGLCFGF